MIPDVKSYPVFLWEPLSAETKKLSVRMEPAPAPQAAAADREKPAAGAPAELPHGKRCPAEND